MTKKIILPISLVVLVGLSVFVSAKMTFLRDRGDGILYSAEVDVKKGWNLVVFGDYQSGGLDYTDMKAVYFYNPFSNDYLQVLPETQEAKRKYDILEKRYDSYFLQKSIFRQQPAWIYFDKKGMIKFESFILRLENIELNQGWNFLVITPEMIGKNLNKLKGNCSIIKAYAWRPKSWWSKKQTWDLIDLDNAPFSENVIGQGIVINTTNEKCHLGTSDSSSVSPPSLPSTTSDNQDSENIKDSENLILKQDFGQLKFNTQLGQEYIESEYHNFPLERMVHGDAAKYGPPNLTGVNAVIIQFNGNKDEFLNKVLAAYVGDSWNAQLLSPPAYPSMYKLTYKNETSNQVALWLSSNYLLIIHGDNVFADGSPAEDMVETYLQKYPSSTLSSGSSGCTDSDGGLDYYVKGTVKCGRRTHTDYCDPAPNTLIEYVTDGTSVGTPAYICQNGCNDGACIP